MALVALAAACGGGGDSEPTAVPASATTVPASPIAVASPTAENGEPAGSSTPVPSTAVASSTDEAQIRGINEDFFAYLQQENWPAIYELYSAEFKGRCTLEAYVGEIDAAKALYGEEIWKNMLENSKLVSVENIQIQGDTATAEVTSSVRNSNVTEDDYFVKEGSKWFLAPVPGTGGCETHN